MTKGRFYKNFPGPVLHIEFEQVPKFFSQPSPVHAIVAHRNEPPCNLIQFNSFSETHLG